MRYPLATYSRAHFIALIGIVLFFLGGGVAHFWLSPWFVAIVPDYIPTPVLAVAVSGACEILGAIGLLMPRTRRAAGIGLLLLIVAVFPANVFMAQHPERFDVFPLWALYLRLPLQLVLLAWVGYAMRRAGLATSL
ncbi:DoxX family protein [Salinisphaera sp. T31B1]|uniref:DoxX family protein n=1 Tax=Salinisphaera sp. T31B1 TaxID=727963 RepID=UPI0033424DAB